MTDTRTQSSAERLSEQTGLTERIIRDSWRARAADRPSRRRVTLRSRFEPAWLHTDHEQVRARPRLGRDGHRLLHPDADPLRLLGCLLVDLRQPAGARLPRDVGHDHPRRRRVRPVDRLGHGHRRDLVPVLAGIHGWNIWLACLVAIGVCLLAGAVNAFFVVVMDVSSFVVTLGTGHAAHRDRADGVRVEHRVGQQPRAQRGRPLRGARDAGVVLLRHRCSPSVIAYVLGWTPLGRSMIFVGANPEVARLAGIRVRRIRAGAYLAGSLLAGPGRRPPRRHRRWLRLLDLGDLPAAGARRGLPRHRRRAARHVQPHRHDHRHLLPHDRHLRAPAARLLRLDPERLLRRRPRRRRDPGQGRARPLHRPTDRRRLRPDRSRSTTTTTRGGDLTMHEATRYILENAAGAARRGRPERRAGPDHRPHGRDPACLGRHAAAAGQGLRWPRGSPQRLHGVGHGGRR